MAGDDVPAQFIAPLERRFEIKAGSLRPAAGNGAGNGFARGFDREPRVAGAAASFDHR